MPEIALVFSSFAGSWRFKRQVTALNTGDVLATADGRAEFTARNNDTGILFYREEGQHYDPELDFFRHYIYARVGEEIHVRYGDGPQTGQMYQRLVAGPQDNLVSKEDHICAADCYSSAYTFPAPDCFILETTVLGPRKNYVIRSEFTREKI